MARCCKYARCHSLLIGNLHRHQGRSNRPSSETMPPHKGVKQQILENKSQPIIERFASVNDNPSQSISTRIFDLHTRGILEWEIGSPLAEHPLERPSLYLTRLSLAAVINGSRDCLNRLVMQFGCRIYH